MCRWKHALRIITVYIQEAPISDRLLKTLHLGLCFTYISVYIHCKNWWVSLYLQLIYNTQWWSSLLQPFLSLATIQLALSLFKYLYLTVTYIFIDHIMWNMWIFINHYNDASLSTSICCVLIIQYDSKVSILSREFSNPLL